MSDTTLEEELAVFHDRMWELGLLAPGVRLTVPDPEHPVARALATLILHGASLDLTMDANGWIPDAAIVRTTMLVRGDVAQRVMRHADVRRESIDVSLGYTDPPEEPWTGPRQRNGAPKLRGG